MDPSMIQIGSSSPTTDQASQGSSSVGFVDQNSYGALNLSEERTLRLAHCILRHIVYFAPPQDHESPFFVTEVRDAKSRLYGPTPVQKRKIAAVDDGGLYLRDNKVDSSRMIKSHVAVIEAKNRFQSIEDGKPIISDACFAQMTCEALATRLATREQDRNEV